MDQRRSDSVYSEFWKNNNYKSLYDLIDKLKQEDIYPKDLNKIEYVSILRVISKLTLQGLEFKFVHEMINKNRLEDWLYWYPKDYSRFDLLRSGHKIHDKFDSYVRKINEFQRNSNEKPCFMIQKSDCQEIRCCWRGICQTDYWAKMVLIRQIIMKRGQFAFKKISDIDNGFSTYIEPFMVVPPGFSLIRFKNTYGIENFDLIDFFSFLLEGIFRQVNEKLPIDRVIEFVRSQLPDNYCFDWSTLADPERFKGFCISHESDTRWKQSLLVYMNIHSVDITRFDFKKKLLPIILDKIDFESHKTIIGPKVNNEPQPGETPMANDLEFDVPTCIYLFEGLSMTELDGYEVTIPGKPKTNDIEICQGNKLIGYFLLTENPSSKKYLLSCSVDQLPEIDPNSKNYTLSCTLNNNRVLNREVDIRMLKTQPTETALCIDLGTSNTSAGAYLDSGYVDHPSDFRLSPSIKLDAINTVKFKHQSEWLETIPTAIYVDDLSKKTPELLFGYEALDELCKQNYAPKASVFKSIKRWLRDPGEKIRIEDKNRITKNDIPCGEILYMYINHIIHHAESQFKCRFSTLHFSCPVKLKETYLRSFQSLMCQGGNQYNIQLKDDALDEGVAVLYELITEKLKIIKPNEKISERALIIDCGGGTTDLASCKIECEDKGDHFKLAINVDREDGATDFGGDKITERIMQFMQLRYSARESDKIMNNIDHFLPNFEDIFREIDQLLKDKKDPITSIYEKLTMECQKAESLFPLNYENYEYSQNEYDRVRNNYYTLWEQAEEMKKAFFLSNEGIEVSFSSVANSGPKISIPFKEFKFHFRDNQQWETKTLGESPSFTIREIETLIAPDIYYVLCNLLAPDAQTETDLINYSHIKLSGQSSRINLFRQALKEFLPGRKINAQKIKTEQQTTEHLKLNCLKGAVQYLNDKRVGKIDLSLSYFMPAIPCEIFVKNYRDEIVALGMKGKLIDNAIAIYDLHIKGTDLRFQLSEDEREIKQFRCYKAGGWKKKNLTEILKIDSRINQENHIDTLTSDKIRYIIWSDPTIYGIYIFAVRREGDFYKISEIESFKFDEIE